LYPVDSLAIALQFAPADSSAQERRALYTGSKPENKTFFNTK